MPKTVAVFAAQHHSTSTGLRRALLTKSHLSGRSTWRSACARGLASILASITTGLTVSARSSWPWGSSCPWLGASLWWLVATLLLGVSEPLVCFSHRHQSFQEILAQLLQVRELFFSQWIV